MLPIEVGAARILGKAVRIKKRPSEFDRVAAAA
jgi:hypothetical protein